MLSLFSFCFFRIGLILKLDFFFASFLTAEKTPGEVLIALGWCKRVGQQIRSL